MQGWGCVFSRSLEMPWKGWGRQMKTDQLLPGLTAAVSLSVGATRAATWAAKDN